MSRSDLEARANPGMAQWLDANDEYPLEVQERHLGNARLRLWPEASARTDRTPVTVPIYDPTLLRKALGLPDEDEFLGPDDERPDFDAPSRTAEGEIWAACVQGILDDPRGHCRPALMGTPEKAKALLAAVGTLPNFAAVTGIIERAIVQSARTGQHIRFPPILMVSPPSVGKTFYCRAVADSMATTCVRIDINGTSDRGQRGGLAQVWRGAKLGKIAKGLSIDSVTASPFFLLDELDKPPAVVAGENTLDVLLSALEPENARAFVDEYLGIAIRLDGALWLASANDTRSIPEPLLSRMLVVDIQKPTLDQARLIIAAIAAPILEHNVLQHIADEAVLPLLDLSARQMRHVLEMAASYAVYESRSAIGVQDVGDALALIKRRNRIPVGFLM